MRYQDKEFYDMPSSNVQDKLSPQLVGANNLIGKNIYNQNGEALGVIDEVVLNAHSGKVCYVVLSYGGLLGFGKKLFALSWQFLKADTDKKRYVLEVDTAKLDLSPGFNKNYWPSSADEKLTDGVPSY